MVLQMGQGRRSHDKIISQEMEVLQSVLKMNERRHSPAQPMFPLPGLFSLVPGKGMTGK